MNPAGTMIEKNQHLFRFSMGNRKNFGASHQQGARAHFPQLFSSLDVLAPPPGIHVEFKDLQEGHFLAAQWKICKIFIKVAKELPCSLLALKAPKFLKVYTQNLLLGTIFRTFLAFPLSMCNIAMSEFLCIGEFWENKICVLELAGDTH